MEEVEEPSLKNQVNKLVVMKYWPVPNSYSKNIPFNGSHGSFWEDRGDRHHCGIDIYAPFGSKVLSIDKGIVLETGIFTTPKAVKYWNETKYILIKNQDGLIFKYAELENILFKTKDIVSAGQVIGYVGTVLNSEKINSNSPKYIQRINEENNLSMLHFEVYSSKPIKSKKYLGGNWFGTNNPKNLLDPSKCLIYK